MPIIKFIRNIFFFFLNFWDLKFDFADNYPMNYPRSIKKFESIFAINSFDLKKNNFRITESFPENIRNQLILEMFFEKKI